jgi:catechol 2,3-dioxygenase-like lactoylglutathione lyase family enzyme
MVPDGILESVLYTSDLDRAEAFYTGVLGFELFGKVKGRHLFFRCGNQMLLIFRPEATRVSLQSAFVPVPTHGAKGEGHLCFKASAEAIACWRERLEAAGVEIEADFVWPKGGRSIYFRDPAGNSLEFAEPRIWGLES